MILHDVRMIILDVDCRPNFGNGGEDRKRKTKDFCGRCVGVVVSVFMTGLGRADCLGAASLDAGITHLGRGGGGGL